MKNTIKILLGGFLVANILSNVSFADKELYNENIEVQLKHEQYEKTDNVIFDSLSEKDILNEVNGGLNSDNNNETKETERPKDRDTIKSINTADTIEPSKDLTGNSNEEIVRDIEKSYLDIIENKIKDSQKLDEEQKKIKENLDFIIQPYLVKNENESYIDIFALQKDYKNHEVFLNYVNDINMILSESEVSFRSLKFRFYGNWCGLGHPAPNKNPRAIDSIDARCRTHDLCYRKYGHKCHCDTQLRNSMRALLPKIKGAYKRGVAQAIIASVPYMMKDCKK